MKRFLSNLKRLAGAPERLDNVLAKLQNRLDMADHRQIEQEMFLLDLLDMAFHPQKLSEPFSLDTEFPIAYDSDDHLHPCGTMNDNTRWPRFVKACEKLFEGRPIHALDLGCAGGGLVFDFLTAGHRALGLEGSDYSQIRRRGMWRVLPNHLKTCDITQPYRISDNGKKAQFNIISAWEVMEHIREDLLPQMLTNIREHLSEDGLFVSSIATFEYANISKGAVYHVTVKPREWWIAMLRRNGLEVVENAFAFGDHVRGIGNGPMDWNAATEPHMGFHLTVRKAKS